MPSIYIVSIASGDPDLLNMKTIKTLKDSRQLFLRTEKSPIVEWLLREKINFSSFDYLYETAENFESLSAMISSVLWSHSFESTAVYAVPDAKSDITVKALYQCRPDNGVITVIPGTGLSDIYLSALCPFLIDSDLRMISATDFLSSEYDPNTSLLITELDNSILAGEVKLHLDSFTDDEDTIIYLHDHDEPVSMPLYQLDRLNHTDHLSAVFIPGSDYHNRKKFVFHDLEAIMDNLRSESGCPWDRLQTHESLQPYMIEEAWECIASIDQHDTDHLCEELGDLLFQVVFHASIGKSFDEFTIGDVISSICSKMIRRHPHVFGNRNLRDAESVRAAWEQIKQEETGHLSAISSLEDVSDGLPSLKYAAKVIKKLSALTPDNSSAGFIVNEIRSLTDGLSAASSGINPDMLGYLLFLCSELCFAAGVDGELILHKTVDRLKSRLKTVEKSINREGKSLEHLTFRELGVYLNHVKGEIE